MDSDSKSTVRKLAKSHNNAPDVFRKGREEKSVQLRKDKRYDRINIERRKCKLDSSQDEITKYSFAEKLKSFDILPQNCALLKSSDCKDRLNGMVFFRRVLAVDKKPPIDLIIELECVIPALIHCLYESNSEKLQVEATWCLTNISCGEPHHITHLLGQDVIPALMTAIANTNHNGVREHAIWAMNNLAVDDRVCQIIGSNMAILSCLLYQVGVECFPLPQINDGSECSGVSYGYRHRSMQDNPALSTMRHITFICGNLIKSKALGNANAHASSVRCVLFGLADLLQSPDDEVILDICQSIAVLCTQYGEVVISAVLEQGMLSRLMELLDVPAFQELSLVAICGILRSPQSYHRKLVLHKFLRSSIAPSSTSSSSTIGNGRKSFIVYCGTVLGKSPNHLVIKDILSGLVAVVELQSMLYARELYSEEFLIVFERLCKDSSHEIKMEIGYLLYHMYRDGAVLLQRSAQFSNQLLGIINLLLDGQESELLVNMIELLDCIVACAVENQWRLSHLYEFQDRLDALLLHPLPVIAEQCRHLEHRLELYSNVVDSEDG